MTSNFLCLSIQTRIGVFKLITFCADFPVPILTTTLDCSNLLSLRGLPIHKLQSRHSMRVEKLPLVPKKIWGFKRLESARQKMKSICSSFVNCPDEKPSFTHVVPKENRNFVGLFIDSTKDLTRLASPINKLLSGPNCRMLSERRSQWDQKPSLWQIRLELISESELAAVLALLQKKNVTVGHLHKDSYDVAFHFFCSYVNVKEVLDKS